MRGIGRLVLLVAFFSLAGLVHAATITGTAYDGLTLEVMENVVVSITTSPVQTKLEKDGAYSFTVPPGQYTLRATFSEQGNVVGEASQWVVVNDEGTYTIDLILLPELGDVPEEPLPGENPGWADQLIQGPFVWMALLGVVLMASGFAIYQIRVNAHNRIHAHEMEKNTGARDEARSKDGEIQLDKYAQEILGHLKRGGNRTTQKELRERMSIGEAKVSLVVSELESYGILKKIKRGRGNILVLTEKGRTYTEKEGATFSVASETVDEKPHPSTLEP